MFVSLLLFCAVSHKGKGHSPRDKQMMAIFVVPDGGVQFNTERNCQPERPSYITVSTFSIWIRSVRSLPGTNIHKHAIIWILEHFCPRSYHFTPDYSLETKTCFLGEPRMILAHVNCTSCSSRKTQLAKTNENSAIIAGIYEVQNWPLPLKYKHWQNIFYIIIVWYNSQSDLPLTQI